MNILSLFRRPQRTAPEQAAPPDPQALGETAPAAASGLTLTGILSGASLPGDEPSGDCTALYRRMQTDPQIRACLSTKKYAVLSRGWELHPATDSPSDLTVADFCRTEISRLPVALLDTLYDLLDALALGVSVIEINWALRTNGLYGLMSLKAKDPSLFIWETDEYLNITGLRSQVDGSELPPDKFLRYAYQPQYSAPLGVSDLRAAWRSWSIKNQLITWWAKYLEKFGMPTVMGSYPAKAGYSQSQQRDFLSIVAQVHNESALIHPDDMTIALLEAQRANTAPFEAAIAYLDRSIAKALLGQTLTTDSNSTGSTYALGAVHRDVLAFYLHQLQRDLEGVVQNQLLARLVHVNYGWDTDVPMFRLGRIDDGQLATSAALITGLISGDVIAPNEPWIRGYLGLPAASAPGVG